jgi:catechol 2,3-dioxygenase-like lactoylglutathione lyase family enzyme
MHSRQLKKRPKLSSRAKRGICFFFAIVFGTILLSAVQNPRPRILGIAQVRIYSTNVGRALGFYPAVLRSPCTECEAPSHPPLGIPLNASQVVVVSSAPAPTPLNLLGEVRLATDDLGGMKRFLAANKIPFAASPEDGLITLHDPEGHKIAFASRSTAVSKSTTNATPLLLIHAGFIVRDRAATEHFYKDILGFRPYWHGGMKDDQTDWVSMQVPDGTDWLEFMVNVEPDADQRLRGILNHIAIGVPDIHAAQKKLQENSVKLTEEPQIGRDGKWQLNLYDPDDTRVEFMEFTPVQKPCCSDYTGPHPKP